MFKIDYPAPFGAGRSLLVVEHVEEFAQEFTRIFPDSKIPEILDQQEIKSDDLTDLEGLMDKIPGVDQLAARRALCRTLTHLLLMERVQENIRHKRDAVHGIETIDDNAGGERARAGCLDNGRVQSRGRHY